MTDSILCYSENDDGCGGAFPYKTSYGLCAKCRKLADLDDASVEYQKRKGYPQCMGCGASWKNMSTDMCGECNNLRIKAPSAQPASIDTDKENLQRTAIEASRIARAHAMDVRVNKQTTETLHAAKASSISTNQSEETIFVSFEHRIKSHSRREQSTTDLSTGTWGRSFSKDTYMTEICDVALKNLNLIWEKDEGMSLEGDEVELRWAGNKSFLAETQSDTLINVYNAHMTPELAHFYAPPASRDRQGTASKKQLRMALEVYVNRPKFLERKEQRLEAEQHLNPRKRSGTTSVLPALGKRQALANPGSLLQSKIVRITPQARTASGGGSTSTKITFTRARTTCDPSNGDVQVFWPGDQDAKIEVGFIEKVPRASGSMKKVYTLTIEPHIYVAKRFFDVGTDTVPTEAENDSFLTKEIMRLKMMDWLLREFKALARKQKVAITPDIFVSDGFLIQEKSPGPSEVSFEDSNDWLPVWLVEPRRSTSTMKFSGTLQHPSRSDKLGMTLCAFAHFVYSSSDGDLAFADIQGTLMPYEGRSALFLFDIMTHTPMGDSGIGDHGQEGLDSFVEQHVCTYMCDEFGFGPLGKQTSKPHPESPGDEDEDDHGE